MRLTSQSPTSHAVTLGNATVLFSYGVPVAVHIEGEGYWRTQDNWSATTNRHVKAFTEGHATMLAPQDAFDSGDILDFHYRLRIRERFAAVTASLKGGN